MTTGLVPISDVNKVVDIHLDAFDGFFLTGLGRNFLKTYYTAILKYPDGLIVGCYEDGELLGFSAETRLSNGFNKRLVKSNSLKFCIEGLRVLFTRPKALVRLFRNFTKSSQSIPDDGMYGELLSICVSKKAQGKGIAKKLLSGLEEIFISEGIKELSLTTDFYNNEKAINLYKSSGYSVLYEFVAYPDRKMYRFIKNL